MINHNMDIETPVREIIANHLGLDPTSIETDSNLESLGADSLDVISIIMDIERAYDIEISEEAASRIRTVHDAISYIRNHP